MKVNCHDFLECIPDAAMVFDAKYRLILWNRKAETLYAIQADDVSGQSIDQILNVLNEAESRVGIKELMQQNDVWRGDVRHLLKDGQAIWVDWSISKCKLERGRTCYLSIARNITGDKKAEESLKSISARQQALLSAIPDIVMEVNNNRIYTWANPAGMEFFGPDVVGKEAAYYFVGDQETYPKVERLFEGDESVIYLESWQRRRDGVARLLAWWCHVLKDGDDRVTGALSTGRDITEIRNAEDSLRNSEERYRLLSDLASEGVMIHEGGVILEANRAFGEITGLTHQNLIGKNGFEIISLTPESKRLVEEHGKTRSDEPYEVEVQKADGSRIYADLRGKNLNYHGRDVRIVRIRDITKEKESQMALRINENRFRLLLQNSNDIIAILDKNGTAVNCSGCVTKILGYEPEELLGVSGFLGVHPDDLPRIRAAFSKALETPGAVRKLEYRYRHKNGSWVDLETIGCNLLHDPDVKGIVLNTRDVTERSVAEKALKASEERFRSFMKHFPGLAYIKDAEGRILFANEKFSEYFNFNPAALVGKNNHDLFPTEFAEKLAQDDRRVLSAGKTEYIEESFGGRIWNTCKFPIVISGATPLLAGFTIDITETKNAEEERKKLETQLQQAMKMEAIGRLAGGVAHDFNNLLTSITGNVQLALMDLRPLDPLADTLSEIRKAANSAAALTRQLLTFSRKQLIEPRALDLNELILRMQKMMARLIGEDIELKTNLGRELGAVKIDPGQFEQIVVNLAVNARDAMPNGGHLGIETARIDLDEEYCRRHSCTRAKSYVMLTVSDTGQGMNDQVKAHLFEPFFTTKEKGKGTGLGLAVIYGIVKQAGGAIEVYSKVNHGTAFKIYLPCVEERAESIEKESLALDMPGGNETILLVEDEAVLRVLVSKVLKRLGYRVLEADSGGNALVIAERHTEPIHLLLTDVVMPGINGRELADRVAKMHSGIKVLYTSGYAEDVIAHRGAIEEGLSFIGKPYDPQGLAKKLREVLG
jgi:two-component system, cell cycle sensor histidine kinase and response regulator CckA